MRTGVRRTLHTHPEVPAQRVVLRGPCPVAATVTEASRAVRGSGDAFGMETALWVLAWGGLIAAAAVCTALVVGVLFGS